MSVIAIDDPTRPRELLYFTMHSLLFGVVEIALGFNRVATALREMMVKVLFFLEVNCNDDFPIIIPDNLKVIVVVAVRSLGMVSGWKWKGGEMDLAFAAKFKALGVMFNLSEVSTGGLLRTENNQQTRPGRV